MTAVLASRIAIAATETGSEYTEDAAVLAEEDGGVAQAVTRFVSEPMTRPRMKPVLIRAIPPRRLRLPRRVTSSPRPDTRQLGGFPGALALTSGYIDLYDEQDGEIETLVAPMQITMPVPSVYLGIEDQLYIIHYPNAAYQDDGSGNMAFYSYGDRANRKRVKGHGYG